MEISNLNSTQRKILSSKRIIMEVSPLEAEFIKAIRLVQYGKVSAQMIEGIPTRIVTEVSAMLEVGEDVLKQLSDSKKG